VNMKFRKGYLHLIQLF